MEYTNTHKTMSIYGVQCTQENRVQVSRKIEYWYAENGALV